MGTLSGKPVYMVILAVGGSGSREFQVEERASTKALRPESAWLFQGPARRPLWLEPGEQGREQEEEKKGKHFMRGPEGHGKDLGIYSERNGESFYHRSSMT